VLEVADYYTRKILEHGPTSKGVDWKDEEGHNLRFEQICKLFELGDFSVCDLGCGYGALFSYMNYWKACGYAGVDISEEMIDFAKKMHRSYDNATFKVGDKCVPSDYCVSSGIFNVRLSAKDEAWREHIFNTLQDMWKNAKQGISFNCLTSYADIKRDYLYYANPLELFDFCKVNFSRKVSLIHDYDLYEFTILVRR
jgi:SAM-dependent methyltransferase